jgi:DNA polymerase elongation subunit (family B)
MQSFYTNVSRYANSILFRGYKNNKPIQTKVPFKPTLFIQSNKPSEFKSLIGNKSISSVDFGNMAEANEFVEVHKEIENFKVYGTTNFVTQFIQKAFPSKIDFNKSLINIVTFDIEVDISTGLPNVEFADKPITSISLKSNKRDTYYLFGLKPYDKTKTITGIDPSCIEYIQLKNEESLLRAFMKHWTSDYPDVVTGWNVEYFDIAYLFKRIENLFGEPILKQMSPWTMLKRTSREIFNRKNYTYDITGISVIDYMDAFKKFGYKYGPQESYKLDHIAYTVLGEKKLSYDEYGSLSKLYEENPQLYLDYNLKDTYLVERLEVETCLLELVMTIAYSAGVNFNDAFGTVGIWESIIYRKLFADKKIPSIKTSVGKNLGELVGGYVKDPKPGMYDWVVSFDLNSLYPHLMLQYNMSPETIISNKEYELTQEDVLNNVYSNTDKSVSVCANGVKFTNEYVGFIPQIIDEYYGNRKLIKDEMLKVEQKFEKDKTNALLKRKANQLHNQQMAVKILMNSLYGAVANKYFLYYISEMAEAITTSGQLAIRYAEKSVNAYLNSVLKTDKDYIIYMDTDSIYVDMAPLVSSVYGDKNVSDEVICDFLDKVCKSKVEDAIRKGYDDLASRMGVYRNAMSMKREKITNKTIFIAKKRYIMNVLNSEGVQYTKPKISVTGIESVRSSTPEVCRKKMVEAFDIVLSGTEQDIQTFIAEFKSEFYKMPVEQIAKISGTDDIGKYTDRNGSYAKGCPIHVRGCILHNNLIKELKLNNKYELIRSGDKVKFVYLLLPNPLRENVISFVDILPKETNLHKFIDFSTQFDKVFLTPLEVILKTIGWESTKTNNLVDFFS